MYTTVVGFLNETAREVCRYLGDVLPLISETWWKDLVLPRLTYQQQRFVEQRNITSLAGLDLAALLRVLDQNWYAVSQRETFSSDTRHYLKEMQSVRNRWAHAGTNELPHDDVYRDLDTLQRFVTVIHGDTNLLSKIQEARQQLLATVAPPVTTSEPPVTSDSEEASATSLQPGQIVVLKSDPTQSGAIVEAVPGEPEDRYSIFMDGKVRSYYASQVELKLADEAERHLLPLDQFHAYLTALQIQHPGLSTLYSLNAARVDFIPYQFRPVLKFIRSDRPRLLIADGVGVGKTIEAGLILRELQARREVKSVLIICPRPLVTERKWEVEMKRFEERFTQLDGKTLRYCINEMDLDGEWPAQHAKTILPYSLLDDVLLYGTEKGSKRKRRREGLLKLDPPPRFDLVIVDEAHHIRNPDTYAHKAVRFFCDNAEAVVFLTATPIQLGSDDLFVLLNTLRPDLILDRQSFEHMTAPNPFINRAIDAARVAGADWQEVATSALESAAATPWGRSLLRTDPEYQRLHALLGERPLTPEERIAAIDDLEHLHTLSGLINRTRRRDIGDFTIRKPETVPVPFTPQQQALHDELLATQAAILSRMHGDKGVAFMMTTMRRQAASCLYGLAPMVEEILSRHLDDLAWEEADESYDGLGADALTTIEDQIQAVMAKARDLDPADPKLAALRKVIADKQALENNKIMLFSSFRHTLRYLHEQLDGAGVRVGLVHGGTPDEERVILRNRFQLPRQEADALDVLLFSEVGCEGLDYQFCDCIVNYDLPWNPMRVEQRIGRIDRKGQKSESVLIYNFITPGTVDAEIYERCLLRIGVFNRALGGSEEILGSIAREIHSVADNIELTEAERQEKLQQMADNEIRLLHEQQELEDRQADLFGIRLPHEQMQQEVEDATSYWLSPKAIENLVTHYLQQRCGREQAHILGNKPLKTLRISKEDREALLADFRTLSHSTSPVDRQWATWLKETKPHLAVTFEATCASTNPEAAFLTPMHPLVKQAAAALESRDVAMTAVAVEEQNLPPGQHPFAIYQWRYRGIHDDLALQPVAESDVVAARLAEFLEFGRPINLPQDQLPSPDVFEALDRTHYQRWHAARTAHQERNSRIVSHRRESLTTSHQARMSILHDQLAQAGNEKIRVMRQAQIANAEADYARRMRELDEATSKVDITAQAVAWGVVVVRKGVER